MRRMCCGNLLATNMGSIPEYELSPGPSLAEFKLPELARTTDT